MQGSSINNRGMNIDLTLKELERYVQLSFKGQRAHFNDWVCKTGLRVKG